MNKKIDRMPIVSAACRKAKFILPQKKLSKEEAKSLAIELAKKAEDTALKCLEAVKKILEDDGVKINKENAILDDEYTKDSSEELQKKGINLFHRGYTAFVAVTPIIEAKLNDIYLQISTATEVCHDGTSTKIWTNMIPKMPKQGIELNSNSTQELVEAFDKITSNCCEVAGNVFVETLSESRKPKVLATLEHHSNETKDEDPYDRNFLKNVLIPMSKRLSEESN